MNWPEEGGGVSIFQTWMSRHRCHSGGSGVSRCRSTSEEAAAADLPSPPPSFQSFNSLGRCSPSPSPSSHFLFLDDGGLALGLLVGHALLSLGDSAPCKETIGAFKR